MTLIYGIDVNVWILSVAMIFVFIGTIMLVWVNKTVGLKYAFQLFQMKRKHNKNKILLKILLPNGKPQYQIKPIGRRIEYDYKENGKTKKASVIYDYYSMYKDFSDIPVLECDPSDIVPRNPFMSTSLSISGSMIEKNIVDSSKDDFKHEELKKWLKYAIPLALIIGGVFLLYSGNQDQLLMACLDTAGKSANIVTN